MQHCLRSIVAASLIASGGGAVADDVRFCIRGESLVPGQEFLQTRQLRITVDGPVDPEVMPDLASRAVQARVWPDLMAARIFVQPYDDAVCGREPLAEVSMAYSAEELALIRSERGRGPADSPGTTRVVAAARSRAAPDKDAPAGTDPSARRHEWLRLYFATSRNPTGQAEPGRAFGRDRADGVRLGTVDVSIPSDHRWAHLESPSVMRLEWDVDPARHIVLAPDYRTMDRAAWTSGLARQAGALGGPGVLLFIHGYNSSFDDAAKRAAQLAYDLAFAGPTVLFSWPSDGTTGNYVRDEQQARNAVRQMAQVLDDLSRLNDGDQSVVVVAHSMGNRVFTEGLVELLRRRPAAEAAFRRVVLAAPDVSVEEFRQRWLVDLAAPVQNRFTLYAASGDVPVALSARLHGERRLGSGGPDIAVFPPMTSIDASAVTREWFGMDHSYFADNETVMSDLFLLLRQGLAPEQRPRLQRMSGSNGPYWAFRR